MKCFALEDYWALVQDNFIDIIESPVLLIQATPILDISLINLAYAEFMLNIGGGVFSTWDKISEEVFQEDEDSWNKMQFLKGRAE